MSLAVVRDKVERVLRDRLSDVRLIDNGYRVFYESTYVDVTLIEQTSRVLVVLSAPVLKDVEGTPDLFKWVATDGGGFYFGSFQYVPNSGDGVKTGSLYAGHTLLGDYLDPEELWQPLSALANLANDKDDELKAKFGGRRATDPTT